VGAHLFGNGGKPSGHIVKRGKLKVRTGAVPATLIAEAVEQ